MARPPRQLAHVVDSAVRVVNERADGFLESLSPELQQTLGAALATAAVGILEKMMPTTAPVRPQLANVLAVLTDADAWQWTDALRFDNAVLRYDATGVGAFYRDESTLEWQSICVIDCNFGDPYPRPDFMPWITDDPAFAWEILQTRGVIPDGYTGRFACTRCGGTSRIVLRNDLVDYFAVPCRACPGPLSRPYAHPQTLPDLASWASLGFAPSDDGVHAGILGAEETAGRTRRGVRVLWRAKEPRKHPWIVSGFDAFADDDMNIIVLSAPPLSAPTTAEVVEGLLESARDSVRYEP